MPLEQCKTKQGSLYNGDRLDIGTYTNMFTSLTAYPWAPSGPGDVVAV